MDKYYYLVNPVYASIGYLVNRHESNYLNSGRNKNKKMTGVTWWSVYCSLINVSHINELHYSYFKDETIVTVVCSVPSQKLHLKWNPALLLCFLKLSQR